MRTAQLKIEYRDFGAVVVRKGRVIFRSKATDARHECKAFIEGYRETEGDAEPFMPAPADLAEIVQW